MRTTNSLRRLAWTLPWLAAAALWVAVVQPLRAEQETRLLEQSRIRRDRVRVDRTAREAGALAARVQTALASSCRAADDPASLRQGVVAATSGLDLAPVRLSASGGPDAGATLDAEGPRPAIEELLRRLGSTQRGGFLRAVTIRMKGSHWAASVTTGLLGSLPASLGPAVSCAEKPDEQSAPAVDTSVRRPSRVRPSPSPLVVRADVPPPLVTPVPEPPSPFTLVGFLRSEGKSRVSVRVGGEVRVISVGESVLGWTCVSIDRDEGAVFTSPEKPRLVLRAGPGH